jgi:hypothetical protein
MGTHTPPPTSTSLGGHSAQTVRRAKPRRELQWGHIRLHPPRLRSEGTVWSGKKMLYLTPPVSLVKVGLTRLSLFDTSGVLTPSPIWIKWSCTVY